MSSSNRVQIAAVREVTPGLTPTNPRMRTVRLTGESLSFTPEFVESEELRADRNMGDPIRIIQASQGGINFELSYPDMLSPMDEILKSACFNSWVNTPTFANDGVGDSVITGVTTTDYVVASTAIPGLFANSLIRATGFNNAANNGLRRAGPITPTLIGAGPNVLVAEPVPPGTARIKVVGYYQSGTEHVASVTVVNGGTAGVSGPVTITGTTGGPTHFTATGTIVGGILQPGLVLTNVGVYNTFPPDLNIEPVTGGSLVGATVKLAMGGSTVALSGALDFYYANLTGVLLPGMWIKVGGTATLSRFAHAGTNDWVRVVSIAYDPVIASGGRTRVTLDNLPPGWGADFGVGVGLMIFFGDQIKNGITPNPMTIQKGFLDQAQPTYIVNRGMQVNTMNWTIINREKIRAVADFMGMTGQQSTTSLDPAPDAATTGAIMAAHANVGRLSEAGSKLTDPNWASEMSFQINNNLRRMEAVDEQSPVGINAGECTVTGRLVTYFGSNAILQKLYNGITTSLNSRVTKNGQALIFQFPRVTLRNGVPAAAGKNQDVTLASDWSAGYDETVGAAIIIDRVEYFET